MRDRARLRGKTLAHDEKNNRPPEGREEPNARLHRARGGRLRKTFRRGVQVLWTARSALIFISLLFWYLRTKYWAENVEAPFSDILGYIATGENIATRFFFGQDDGHPTYLTPVTPSLIAIAKLIWPTGYDIVFRFLVQTILFVAALRMVRELRLLTGKAWIGISFLLIVAICRPSIFWSLKLSTEQVGEAMLYATLATGLATLRTRSLGWAAACGFFAICLGLNRPNFLPSVMLIPACFLFAAFANRGRSWREERSRYGSWIRSFAGAATAALDRRSLAMAAAFLLVFFGVWSVWLGRNIINYGAFIPTSSSNSQVVLWEYGGAPIKVGRYDSLTMPDGTKFSNFGSIMNEVERYSPDYNNSKYLWTLARAWYAANWTDLPRLFMWRLKELVTNRGASGLTALPRDHLFFVRTPNYNNPFTPIAWKELLLLDKEPLICFAGLIGLLVFLRTFPGPGALLFALAVVPWFATAAVIGYTRAIEILIALTIWCALYLIVWISSELSKRVNHETYP